MPINQNKIFLLFKELKIKLTLINSTRNLSNNSFYEQGGKKKEWNTDKYFKVTFWRRNFQAYLNSALLDSRFKKLKLTFNLSINLTIWKKAIPFRGDSYSGLFQSYSFSELRQTSKIEHFAEYSILDVWQDSEYALSFVLNIKSLKDLLDILKVLLQKFIFK